MILKKYYDGTLKIHIEDNENYEVTDDNGVDIWLSKEQIERLKGVLS